MSRADVKVAAWTDDPSKTGVLTHLLPPALPSHPSILFGRGGPAKLDATDATAILSRIKAERLFWPTPRYDAVAAPVVVDLSGLHLPDAAPMLDNLLSREAHEDVLVIAAGRSARVAVGMGCRVAPNLSHVNPEELSAIYGPLGAAAPYWAALGGVRAGWMSDDGVHDVDPLRWLLRVEAVDPWRGGVIEVAEGLDALAFLHREAARNARPMGTVGMSRWKRRNIAPFLAGPTGLAQHFRKASSARRTLGAEGVLVHWGDSPTEPGRVERAEDGFIRSVGLGVRHTPPASLAIAGGGLHFEAGGVNSFVRLARETAFTPALLSRAARLRETVIRRRITKYNLAASNAPPPAGGKMRLLVPGQVEGDASLVHGSPALKTNAALLAVVRARHPDAFLLYKPHPDVFTGLRPGAVPAETLALADAVAVDMSAEACLDWADKIETMTSLMGFEALLRGKAVATHGRPFYAGWGLAEDMSGLPARGELSLDALVAAALILYPRYIDPITGLPAPPEVVIDALTAERRNASAPMFRIRTLRRRLVSSLLNQFG